MSNKTGILILLKYLLNSCVCRHPIIRYLPVVKIENWYKYVVGMYVHCLYTATVFWNTNYIEQNRHADFAQILNSCVGRPPIIINYFDIVKIGVKLL